MHPRSPSTGVALVLAFTLVAACGLDGPPVAPGSDAGADASSHDSGGLDATTDSGTEPDDAGPDADVGDATTDAEVDSGVPSACPYPSDVDADGDGFSPDSGDCDDCDPAVNPRAIDVFDGVAWSDDDCDGTAGSDVGACDDAIALDDTGAVAAARALDLCRTTTIAGSSWGVISAAYERVDGRAMSPGPQVGVQSAWGTNVGPRGGSRLLAMSTGRARTPGQADACADTDCTSNADGVVNGYFPGPIATCVQPTAIRDDVALELVLRVPSNAVGFSFASRLYSFDFPESLCSAYVDQAAVYVGPLEGGWYGNVLLDPHGDPIRSNAELFATCEAATPAYDDACSAFPACCALGGDDLIGTGFDTLADAGATAWLVTTVPVVPGSTVLVRFVIADSGDAYVDSSVLFDDFRWITDGTPVLGTAPIE